MEIFLTKAAQLILALVILIVIHEFGHFLFARIFGVRVEKFYIFFDPWTELFKWKPGRHIGLMGRTRTLPSAEAEEKAQAEAEKSPRPKGRFWRDTEYGVGWLPLGGYCKMSGMIDESMDTEQMRQEPQPYEFRSKPAWQRLLIMIAGVLFNFLTAIIIYAGIVYATGEKFVPLDKTPMGMTYSGVAHQAGFRDGDIPLEADGHPIANPDEARMQMLQADTVTVLRDGHRVDIAIPQDLIFRLEEEAKSDTVRVYFMSYRIPTHITQVAPGEGAAKAGIRPGDRIIAIDSVPTESLDRFLTVLEGHENQTVTMTVTRPRGEVSAEEAKRDVPRDTLTVAVPLSASSKMGVGLEVDPTAFFPVVERHYSLLQSVPRGIRMGTDKLKSYASSMRLVFTREGAKSVGGFGTLGSIFPEKWNWVAFWNIAAFLAVALAFMNILPIPALDGGHVLFLIYEVVTGRKPSDKFMEYAQMTGMFLLIALLLYANGMDIVRFFIK